MAGIIGKALAGAGTGLAQASLIELQNQATEARERRLAELKAELTAKHASPDVVEVGDSTSPTGTRYTTKRDAIGKPGKGTKDSSRKTYGDLGVIPGTKTLGQKDSDGQWHPLPNQSESMNDLVGDILGKVSRGEKITESERDVLKIYQDFRLDPMSRTMGAALSGQPLDSANLDSMLAPYMQEPAQGEPSTGGDAAAGNAPAAGGGAAPASGGGGRFTEGQTAVNDKGQRIIFSGGKWVPAAWKDGGWKPAN